MIIQGESLALHTTLKVGGAAEYFTTVTTKEQLVAAVTAAQTEGKNIYILGGGSNLLVSDNGVKGFVIKNDLRGRSYEQVGDFIELTVAAGEVLDEVVAYTVSQGWWGIENLSHIPGSIGATPVQNVGAYGVEVKDVIKSVEVLDTVTNEFVLLSNGDCQFDYRHSIFKTDAGKRYVVTGVTFLLELEPKPILNYKDLQTRFGDQVPEQQTIRDAVIEIRSKKFPDWHQTGTAGSFFKNPIISKLRYEELKTKYPELPCYMVSDSEVKVPLGWVLDQLLQLRGVRDGNVGTFEGQALVLINEGGATAAAIETFASSIEQRVHDLLGIKIEWEVTRW